MAADEGPARVDQGQPHRPPQQPRPRPLAVACQRRIRFRANFAYVDGHERDGTVLKLCQLRYGGSAHLWGFAIYRASHDDYEDSHLPTDHTVNPDALAISAAAQVRTCSATSLSISSWFRLSLLDRVFPHHYRQHPSYREVPERVRELAEARSLVKRSRRPAPMAWSGFACSR